MPIFAGHKMARNFERDEPPHTPGLMPTKKHLRILWWAMVIGGPAALKLFFLRADQVFETYTAALDLVATGQFGHHYFGTWDRSFQLPVHTALVALFHLVGLGTTSTLVFQVGCGALTALLVHRMALHLLRGTSYAGGVAWVSALLTGLNPFMAYYQVRMVHPFAWDTLLAIALLYGSLTADPARRPTVVALFALGGLALLNRPTLGVFLLPFALRHTRSMLSMWRPMSLAVLFLLLFGPLGGWVIRNHAVTGRYQITSVTDQLIWIGLQESTEGAGHLADGRSYWHLLCPAECVLMFSMDTPERSAFFKAKWEAETRADPSLRWRMLGVKLRNFWLFRSHAGLGHTTAMAWGVVLFKWYAAALLLLLLAQAVVFRHPGLLLVITSVAALSLIQCMFYFETRHRLLAEPLLMMVGVATMAMLLDRWRRRPGKGVIHA